MTNGAPPQRKKLGPISERRKELEAKMVGPKGATKDGEEGARGKRMSVQKDIMRSAVDRRRSSTTGSRRRSSLRPVAQAHLRDTGRFEAGEEAEYEVDGKPNLKKEEVEFHPRSGEDFHVAELPHDFVKSYIHSWVGRSNLAFDFALYIPYLILFVFFVYGERETAPGYWVTHMAKDITLGNEIGKFGWEITKTYEDLLDKEEWWQWFEAVLVPNVYPSESAEVTPVFTLQAHVYLLGAARLRTIIAANDSCEVDGDLFRKRPPGEEGYPCYGTWQSEEEKSWRYFIKDPMISYPVIEADVDNSTFLYPHRSCVATRGGQVIIGDYSYYHCGGYYVDVPFFKTQGEVVQAIQVYKNQSTPFFEDVATRFGAVEFFVHTPSHGSFTSVKLFFEQSVGGDFYPQFQIRNFYIWTSDGSNLQTIFDFLFFAVFLYVLYRFILAWQLEASLTRWWRFLYSGWNILDFVNFAMMLTGFALRWAWWSISENSEFTRIPFPNEYPSDLDNLLTLYSTIININSVAVVLTFLKMLKYLQIYPRLGILTLSLAAKGLQLCSVLVLFFWSVLAYAMAMWSLFGGEIFDFRTLGESYSTLLRMMTGDLSLRFEEDLGMAEKHGSNGLYGAMRDTNRVLAGFFFWTYIILLLFILLNMIIAVMAEGFSEINQQYANSSFSDDIAYAVERLKFLLSCSRIKRMIKAWRRGASVTETMKSLLVSLKEHERCVKGEMVTNPSEMSVTRSTLEYMMSRRDRAHLGKRSIDELWDDIVVEWQYSQLTPTAIDDEELKQDVAEGIKKATDPILTWMEHTLLSLHNIERRMIEFVDICPMPKGVNRRRSRRVPMFCNDPDEEGSSGDDDVPAAPAETSPGDKAVQLRATESGLSGTGVVTPPATARMSLGVAAGGAGMGREVESPPSSDDEKTAPPRRSSIAMSDAIPGLNRRRSVHFQDLDPGASVRSRATEAPTVTREASELSRRIPTVPEEGGVTAPQTPQEPDIAADAAPPPEQGEAFATPVRRRSIDETPLLQKLDLLANNDFARGTPQLPPLMPIQHALPALPFQTQLPGHNAERTESDVVSNTSSGS